MPATAIELSQANDLNKVLSSLAAKKPIDTELARRVRRTAEAIREDIYRKHGVLEIGVPAIRELRGDLPE